MIDFENLQLISTNLGAAGNAEILQNVRNILTTPLGTVPFDRNFGIDISLIDEPLEIAKGKLIVEYISKVRKYEPRASIQEVQYETNLENGKIIPRVVIQFESE